MDFNINDSELTAALMIHSMITDANEIANKIEAVIQTDPDAPAYGFPKENVYKIISALRMNASLASDLFEEYQKHQEMIQEVMKKINKLPKPE